MQVLFLDDLDCFNLDVVYEKAENDFVKLMDYFSSIDADNILQHFFHQEGTIRLRADKKKELTEMVRLTKKIFPYYENLGDLVLIFIGRYLSNKINHKYKFTYYKGKIDFGNRIEYIYEKI
jgi:hypothetical protein